MYFRDLNGNLVNIERKNYVTDTEYYRAILLINDITLKLPKPDIMNVINKIKIEKQ